MKSAVNVWFIACDVNHTPNAPHHVKCISRVKKRCMKYYNSHTTHTHHIPHAPPNRRAQNCIPQLLCTNKLNSAFFSSTRFVHYTHLRYRGACKTQTVNVLARGQVYISLVAREYYRLVFCARAECYGARNEQQPVTRKIGCENEWLLDYYVLCAANFWLCARMCECVCARVTITQTPENSALQFAIVTDLFAVVRARG